LTTIIALSVGWFFDRRNCEQKEVHRKQELSDAIAGSVFAAYARNTLDLAERLPKSQKSVDEFVSDRLAGNVWSLWKNESLVNTALKSEPNGLNANQLAEQLLDSMKCRTVDEYLSRAKLSKDFSNYPQLFPEIFESKSAGFDSFCKFIGNALGEIQVSGDESKGRK
jgi:hypothetical protein